MQNHHVTIQGDDREAMADLVRLHHVTVFRQTLAKQGNGYRVSAVADPATIERLQSAGYRVEQHEDVDETARVSLRHVGQGNRFLDQPGEAK